MKKVIFLLILASCSNLSANNSLKIKNPCEISNSVACVKYKFESGLFKETVASKLKKWIKNDKKMQAIINSGQLDGILNPKVK